VKTRLYAAIVIALCGLLLFFKQSRAFDTWCFDDPVIQIGNEMVETTVGVYGDPAWVSTHVKSATITYHLPVNTKAAKVRSTSAPYFAEVVQFVYDGAPVQYGQPVPVTVVVTFQTDAIGAGAPAQMVNTVQSATKGPQTGPAQGNAVTVTTYGDTRSGLTASGLVPSGEWGNMHAADAQNAQK
jgi:hypothetical protein